MALVVTAWCAPATLCAQDPPILRRTPADELLEQGRWPEAESAFYEQSERNPRDPFARAALGQFLAMKGAIRPGIVLIEEAQKFGLDAGVARKLIVPWRAILDWRSSAAGFRRDTTFIVSSEKRRGVLFVLPLPRADRDGKPRPESSGATEIVWHDIVDRAIGLDSLNKRGHPIGIEIFDGLAPSVDVRDGELTLHANPRSALSANGRRYQVLRSPRGIRVLVDQRVYPLADALLELSPTWWQLDLTRGLLVVR